MKAAQERISSPSEKAYPFPDALVSLPLAAAWELAENSPPGFTTKEINSPRGWSAVNFQTAAGIGASLRWQGSGPHCQTWNLYAYVRNNPTTNVDPDGLDCISAVGEASGSALVTVTAGSDCSQGQTYIAGTVDMSSLTYNGTTVGYGYTPYDTSQEYTIGAGITADPAISASAATVLGSVYQQSAGPVNFFAGATFGFLGSFGVGSFIDSFSLPMSLGLEGQPVIGKTTDLGPNLGPNERELALPDQGDPQANWAQNSTRLRQEMAEGRPIKDATALKYGGPDKMNTGFLRAERNLLENHGWTYNSGYWFPPGK